MYDFKNLSIFSLDYAATQALADLADRNIKLTITIQDGEVWVSSDTANIEIKPQQHVRNAMAIRQVVVLHGLYMSGFVMRPLCARLEKSGLKILNLTYNTLSQIERQFLIRLIALSVVNLQP